MRAELEDRYASSSEELRALSIEKRKADEACSALRDRASALDERTETMAGELKVRVCVCLCVPFFYFVTWTALNNRLTNENMLVLQRDEKHERVVSSKGSADRRRFVCVWFWPFW